MNYEDRIARITVPLQATQEAWDSLQAYLDSNAFRARAEAARKAARKARRKGRK